MRKIILPILLLAFVAASPKVTKQDRLDAIKRAQVWMPTDIPSMDIVNGPQDDRAFTPFAEIRCYYTDKKLAGQSPKFACSIPPDDTIKVKYGKSNGEVYSEVAASRLLWALGFGA